MPEYDNTNKGVIFKNDRRDNDRQPEYTGSLNVDGVEYWLSAWVKDGKKGKFFSLAIKPKVEPKSTKPLREEMNDDIPF